MSIIKKHESVEKINKRIAVCRAAGYQIQQNFIAGTKEVLFAEELVLRCRRDADGWFVEYNDKFWDEVEKEDVPAEEKA